MKLHFTLQCVANCLLFVFAACTESRSATQEVAPAPKLESAIVKVVRPRVETLRRVVQIPSTVEPFARVAIQSRVSGVVAEVRVDRGDRVKKGQVVARISVPEMPTEVLRTHAAVKVAEAEVKRDELQSNRLTAAARANREAIAPQRVEAAQAALAVSRARLAARRADVAYIEGLARDTVLRAPFDGVVTNRWVDPGAALQAGSGVRGASSPLLVVENQDKLRVVVDVAEADVPAIRLAMPVSLSVRADPGRVIKGAVSRTASALDPATRTMRVEIDLPNHERRLVVGMDLLATIDLGERPSALTLPAEAVRRDSRGTYVWLIGDGRAVRRDVGVGIDTGPRLEIRTGLRAGDAVVLWGHALLEEGQPVRAEETKP
ncbi:MAG: efflux RND transporter periplasmic adaptor subunit [Deltaproteobacteria bacterium]|nr:efflux RND transporter periplasmic adaptor subunit [Deltaproteobacteria bacterium]